MKTVTFWYVRHGQTLFNKLDKMQGWCDSPLTEQGIKNAEEAREILKGVPLNAAYTSTSERCRDTCAIVIEGRGIPVHEKKGLKEINFGTWEAVPQGENEEQIAPRRAAVHWEDCGGDSFESLRNRIIETYNAIYDECSDGDNVLIVSHGGVWIWIQSELLGVNKEEFFRMKMEKGVPPMPNGYNGCFTCTDGVFRLKSSPGCTEEDINKLYKEE